MGYTQLDESNSCQMKVVNIVSVSKVYNGAMALQNVSLGIEAGERIVFIGPSGCGKTTLLRLIAGFIAPDSGSISLSDELASKNGRILKPPEQRHLGMVFQDLALWPHLTVKGNIEFGLKACGMQKSAREAKIRKILNLVGMADTMGKKPGELSGGQQQRVALARALVLEPKVLLMDEPLSSLDPELNLRIRREILRLQGKLGFTMLYVTHNLDEALELATRVVIMSKGEIEFTGSAEDAENHFKGDFPARVKAP
jgi:ABC-type Fe3+/spermidine/putrescine transport system ATPase subunit